MITDDTRASATAVVRACLKRWAVQLLIKDEKHPRKLGSSDDVVPSNFRGRAVVRHLHLVDCAHACLTHLGLKDQRQGAQGEKPTKRKPLALPPISQLKARMRQVMWREAVEDVVKVSHDKRVTRRLEKLMAA